MSHNLNNKYYELPIQSLLMFLNTDTRITHSRAISCPQIRVILARQGEIRSIPALLFVATSSNVAQRPVACEDGRYPNLDAAQVQTVGNYSLLS